jgi:hypothetical protein
MEQDVKFAGGRDSHPLKIADFHGVLVFSESKKTVGLMRQQLPLFLPPGVSVDASDWLAALCCDRSWPWRAGRVPTRREHTLAPVSTRFEVVLLQ